MEKKVTDECLAAEALIFTFEQEGSHLSAEVLARQQRDERYATKELEHCHCRYKPHQERPSGEALLVQREQNRLPALFFNTKMIRRVGTAILQKEEEVRL